jgi:hypothetical protein
MKIDGIKSASSKSLTEFAENTEPIILGRLCKLEQNPAEYRIFRIKIEGEDL